MMGQIDACENNSYPRLQNCSPSNYLTDSYMSEPVITLAKAPFDDPNAEIILRSSDNVDFYVFKLFLSFSSSVFRDMFFIPQPVDNGLGSSGFSEQTQKDGLPVISMTEPSEVVEKLLMFCYPKWGAEPVMEDLDEVQTILVAANKYDMEGVRGHIQKILMASKALEDEIGHLRVFGIACRYGMKEAAMEAMRRTLNHPVLGRSYVKELDHISPNAYHQLLDYHWRCSVVARQATELEFIPPLCRRTWVPECRGSCTARNFTYKSGLTISPPKYFTVYMDSVRKALKARPCSATVLKSGTMDDALREASQCGSCRDSAIDKLRTFVNIFANEIERVTNTVGFQNASSISRLF
jgi:hypothetical protein